jgi:peroxiredoxin Q/BCP
MLEWMFPAPLPVGAPAPDFVLPDQDGNRVKLSAMRGSNVVLVFYPGDDTLVCTRQLCEFRDDWSAMRAANAVVLGINPARGSRHSRFRDKHRFPFPLLVDQGQKIGRLYRAAGLLAPRRTVYLVGPDGTIRYARRGKPAPAEVLAASA